MDTFVRSFGIQGSPFFKTHPCLAIYYLKGYFHPLKKLHMVIFYCFYFILFFRENHKNITQDGRWGGMNLQSRQNHCKPTKMCVSAIKTHCKPTKCVCVYNQDRIIANQQNVCVCIANQQNVCVCNQDRIIANQQTVSALQTNRMYVSAIKTESLQTNKMCEKLYYYWLLMTAVM